MKAQDPQLARALGPVAKAVQDCRDAGHMPQGRLHVAVSGGADSTLLFLMLYRLRRRLGLRLSLGHVDHGLREGSKAEAEWVQTLAAQYHTPCELDRLSLQGGPGLPQRARMARRQRLELQASRQGAFAIALAHTATDQMETMIMHASRGAGLAGLGGMKRWSAPYLRPMMHLSRQQVQQLALRCTRGFMQDPSNRHRDHARVRVREEVLPRLHELNPRVEFAWGRLAQQAQESEQAIEAWAQRELQPRREREGHYSLHDFDLLPMAVAMTLLRIVLRDARISLQELRYELLRKICDSARYRAALAGRRCEPPPGGLGPLHFDLHPQGHLTLARTKLSILLVARR